LPALFADEKQPKLLEKMPKIRKNFDFKVVMIFLKHF